MTVTAYGCPRCSFSTFRPGNHGNKCPDHKLPLERVAVPDGHRATDGTRA